LATEEKVIGLTSGAYKMWDDFYQTVERNEETERFDTYGQRLMSLLAFTSGKSEIDEQVVQAVLDVLEYQRVLRELYWPSEAETQEALVEDKVLRFLKRKCPMQFTAREIEQYTKLRKKYGADAPLDALQSLIRSGEVIRIAAAAVPGQKSAPRYRWVGDKA
jgi:hypothetical protein